MSDGRIGTSASQGLEVRALYEASASYTTPTGEVSGSGGSRAEATRQSAELQGRLVIARARLQAAALSGQRIRAYQVALDLDLSEFHFARQFRIAFACSPHAYYDEMRALRARELLEAGYSEGDVARRVGFRRPAELRALLQKRGVPSAA